MAAVLVKQLKMIMFLDHQSHTVIILVNMFGHYFAVGISENVNTQDNCPCTQYPGRAPPSFVGNNYYCESATIDYGVSGVYYFNDILWDGAGCVVGNNYVLW